MITSGSDAMTSEDADHICTDADMCMADQPQEHMIVMDAPVEDASQASSKIPKKTNVRTITLVAVGVIIVVVGGLSAFVYTHAANDKTVKALTTRLPFPALFVGRSVVTYQEYYNEQDSLKKYFASSAVQGTKTPTEDQLNGMIAQTLTNKAVVKTLAGNYGLTLDQSKVEAFYQNVLKQNAGQTPATIEKQLKDTFGWTVLEFKQHVVEPIVLSQEVSDYIAKNEFYQKPLRDEINSAHTRVTTGGEDFEKVGTEVHDRVQLKLKGDLGFIKKSALPSAWGDKVANLENGKVTDVIELPQGYAIFKVADRIKAQDTGKKTDPKAVTDEQIHLYTITVPKKTLDQVMADYLKNVSVKTLIKV